jgi:hypothetical protein
MPPTTVFDDWRDGAIGDREALRALLSDLGEVESQIAPLEAERIQLRAQISEVLSHLGGRAEADGFRLILTAPAIVPRYDAMEPDALVVRLRDRGSATSPTRSAARKETARSGCCRSARRRTCAP